MQDKPKEPLTARMLGRVWNILDRPQTVVPEEKKQDGKQLSWEQYKTVDYFTKRNRFALDLLLLSELAPTHRGCIYTKADYEFGEGFGIIKGKNQSIIKTKTAAEKQNIPDEVIVAAEEALSSVNLNNESYLEVCRQVRINLNTSGNGYIELVWGGEGANKYFKVYNHDFHKVLFVQPEGTKNITHAYISDSWANDYLSRNEPVKLPVYPLVETIDGSSRTLLHIKEYSIGRDYYGLPLFVAGKMAAQLEYESDRHNLERFFADFMPKIFAAFFAPGGMTQQEKDKFYDEFMDTYTKRGRDGNVQAMVQVFESEKMQPFFHEFNVQNSDGDFSELKNGAGQSVYTAHRWHPVLAGVPIASGLNDAKQVQNIFSIYNKLTIKPNQTFDLNAFVNPVFEAMCEWLGLPCVGYQLTLESSAPISFLGQVDVNALVTVDEGRVHVGQDKLNDDRGKKLIIELQKSTKPDGAQQPNTGGMP